MLQLEKICARIEVLVTLLYSYNPHCMELLCLIYLVVILTLPELFPKPITAMC